MMTYLLKLSVLFGVIYGIVCGTKVGNIRSKFNADHNKLIELSRKVFQNTDSMMFNGKDNLLKIRTEVPNYMMDVVAYQMIKDLIQKPHDIALQTKLMKAFFASPVGSNFQAAYKEKGFSLDDQEAAFKETWFTKQNVDGKPMTSFQKVFTTVTANQYPGRSGPFDWYSYTALAEMGRLSHLHTGAITNANKFNLYGVTAFWKIPQVSAGSTKFLLGAHPFQSLAAYTMCAWTSTKMYCQMASPGGSDIMMVGIGRTKMSDPDSFLKEAYPFDFEEMSRDEPNHKYFNYGGRA